MEFVRGFVFYLVGVVGGFELLFYIEEFEIRREEVLGVGFRVFGRRKAFFVGSSAEVREMDFLVFGDILVFFFFLGI